MAPISTSELQRPASHTIGQLISNLATRAGHPAHSAAAHAGQPTLTPETESPQSETPQTNPLIEPSTPQNPAPAAATAAPTPSAAVSTVTGADIAHPLDTLTPKQIRALKRADFLEMLVEQGEEIERLRQENARLTSELESKRITLAESGNIAEAALKLSGIFEAAQAACDQYIQNAAQNAQQPDAQNAQQNAAQNTAPRANETGGQQ